MEETKTKTVKLSAYVIDNDDMGKKQMCKLFFYYHLTALLGRKAVILQTGHHGP